MTLPDLQVANAFAVRQVPQSEHLIGQASPGLKSEGPLYRNESS